METVINALYRDFLLRDVLGKAFPGSLVLYSLIIPLSTHQVSSIELPKEVPTILIMAFASWFIGFVVQGIGVLSRLVWHYPRQYSDSLSRYMLRSQFNKIASDKDVRQVERLTVIKEACGNASTAIVVSLLLIAMRNSLPEKPETQVSYFILRDWSTLVIIALIISSMVLLYQNRLHAQKQYEYMKSVLSDASLPVYALVFDLDGTIADSMTKQENAWRDAIKNSGLSSKTDVEEAIIFNLKAGYAGDDIFQGVSLTEEVKADLRKRKDELWEKQWRTVRLFPNARKAILQLAGFYRISLATNTSSNYTNTFLKRHKLNECFEATASPDNVGVYKPSLEILASLKHQLNVPYDKMCVIGDARADWELACSAGAAFIRFGDIHEDWTRGVSWAKNWQDLLTHLVGSRAKIVQSGNEQ